MTFDGVPLNEPEDSAVYTADFGNLALNVASVQVQRGVGTSTFGAAAFAGSVNLESLDATRTPGLSVSPRRRLLRDGAGERELELGDVRRRLEALAAPVVADDGRLPRALGREAGQPLLHGRPRLRDVEPEDLGLRRRRAHPAGVLRGRAGDPREEPRVQPDVARRARPLPRVPRDGAVDARARRRREPLAPAVRRRRGRLVPPLRRRGRGRTSRSTASRGSSAAGSRPTRGSSARSASRSARTRTATSRRTRRTTRTATRNYTNHGTKSELSGFAKLLWDSGRWHPFLDAQVRHARLGYEGERRRRGEGLDVLQPEGGRAPRPLGPRERVRLRRPHRARARRGATSSTGRTTPRPCPTSPP